MAVKVLLGLVKKTVLCVKMSVMLYWRILVKIKTGTVIVTNVK